MLTPTSPLRYAPLPCALALCLAASARSPAAPSWDNTNVRSAETHVGTVVAEALRLAAKADLALVNAGALKPAKLDAAAPTADDLTAQLVYPAEKVAVLKLTGAQVKAALERGLSTLPKPSNGFLQVSGVKCRFAVGAASGQRVQSLTLAATGKPVDPAATYRVATTLSLAKGALGYFTVFGPQSLTSVLDATLREAVENLAEDAGKLAQVADGRLVAQ